MMFSVLQVYYSGSRSKGQKDFLMASLFSKIKNKTYKRRLPAPMGQADGDGSQPVVYYRIFFRSVKWLMPRNRATSGLPPLRFQATTELTRASLPSMGKATTLGQL